MGRLIDEDVLLKAMDKRYKEKHGNVPDNLAEGFMQMEKLIKEQPTAYDVEKVVTELEVEKERHDTDRSYWAEHEWKDRVIYNECDMSDKKSNCFDLSIDIVKRGGVE